MRRSGAAAHGTHPRGTRLPKGACSRSTATRRPSRPATAVFPTKCGLRSSARRLPISPRACRGSFRAGRARHLVRPRRLFAAARRPARGFSFRADGPLDMRMDPSSGEPVSAWLARAGEPEIREVIAKLGEERFARRIAATSWRRAPVSRSPARSNWPRSSRRAHARARQESGDRRSRRCACTSTTSSGRFVARSKPARTAERRRAPRGHQLSTRWKTASSNSSSRRIRPSIRCSRAAAGDSRVRAAAPGASVRKMRAGEAEPR